MADVCEHLTPVKEYILSQGAKVTFAGQAWSKNCRMWIYFDVFLDAPALIRRFQLPPCVTEHEHRGTHDGQEYGLVCEEHQDALMGYHVSHKGDRVIG